MSLYQSCLQTTLERFFKYFLTGRCKADIIQVNKEVNINRQELFNEYFLYTDKSCSFIKWKSSPAQKANVKVGDDAGWLTDFNYWNVQLFGKSYRVHRVIYEMHFGEIPEGCSIDHLNGNRQDNRVLNLRVVTHRENNRNQGMYKNNNTGITGVTFWEDSLGRGGYRATVYLETGKKKTKYFSCLKHGVSDALNLASEWRVTMLEELNQNNAGYTERHGKLAFADKVGEPFQNHQTTLKTSLTH